jgi:hypothetical protein
MKRFVLIVKLSGIVATFAAAAVAAPLQGHATRQLTGKVTAQNARAITVRAPSRSLTCATRAGLHVGKVVGKRARMTCRMTRGTLVVAGVTVLGVRPGQKQAPSQQSPSQTPTNQGNAADPSDDDPNDDDGEDDAGDDGDDGDDDGEDDGDDDDGEDDDGEDDDGEDDD